MKTEVSDVKFSHLLGESPLSLAVFMNKLDAVKILLNKGANVNRQHPTQLLHDAIKSHCHPKIIKLLLQAGANPNLYVEAGGKNTYSINALHVACEHGRDFEVVNIILKSKFINFYASDSRFFSRIAVENIYHFAVKNPFTTKILDQLLIQNLIEPKKWMNLYPSPLDPCFTCTVDASTCKALLIFIKHNIESRKGTGGWPVVLTQHGHKYPCPVIAYYKKLQLLNCNELGFPLKKLTSRLDNKVYEHPNKNGTEKDWKEEISRMKNVTICVLPKVTLHDFMFLKSQRISRYERNGVLAEIFKNGGSKGFEQDYPYFGFVLNRNYQEALEKGALLKLSQEFLEFVIKARLPDDVSETIFKFFGQNFLKTLQIDKI